MASFRRSFFAHLRWNVGFVVLALLVLCCVTIVVYMPAMLLSGSGSSIGIAIVLPVFAIATVAIFSIHQGATLAIVAGERAGAPISSSDAFNAGFARIEVIASAMLARVVVDAAVAIVPASAVLVLLEWVAEGWMDPAVRIALAMLAAYAAGLAGMIGVRTFLGVSGPVAFHERGGAVAALSRSVELLRGHRGSMALARVLWAVIAVVIYGSTNAPLLLVAAAGMRGGVATLLVTLYAFVPYVTSLMLLSFDTTLESVFYAERTRKDDARDIARAFE
ncbi:hypothetical protein DB32_007948 [Sandaracinus amylolyticus]|uniref:Uncharacterized protein n=1 Tax=Sandaracinus amylolyticus TaxID=927083 RepID=A0A0F6SHP4_9BACT|nr:hypothetical protein DB32_007948 [Sandaracinus amylolyticus]